MNRISWFCGNKTFQVFQSEKIEKEEVEQPYRRIKVNHGIQKQDFQLKFIQFRWTSFVLSSIDKMISSI